MKGRKSEAVEGVETFERGDPEGAVGCMRQRTNPGWRAVTFRPDGVNHLGDRLILGDGRNRKDKRHQKCE